MSRHKTFDFYPTPRYVTEALLFKAKIFILTQFYNLLNYRKGIKL